MQAKFSQPTPNKQPRWWPTLHLTDYSPAEDARALDKLWADLTPAAANAPTRNARIYIELDLHNGWTCHGRAELWYAADPGTVGDLRISRACAELVAVNENSERPLNDVEAEIVREHILDRLTEIEWEGKRRHEFERPTWTAGDVWAWGGASC